MTTFELEKEIKQKLYRAFASGIITANELESLPVRLGCLALNLIDADKEEEGVTVEQATKWLLQRRTEVPLWLRNLAPELYVPGLPPPEITPEEQSRAERFIKLGIEFEFLTEDEGLLYFTDDDIQNYFCAVYCLSQSITNDLLHRINPDNANAWSDLDPFLADKIWKFVREGQEDKQAPGGSFLLHLESIGYWKNKTLWTEITREQIVTLLIDDLKNSDDFIRSRAASILTGMLNPRLIEPFLIALQDPNSKVRSYAANGLGALEEKRAVPALIELLGDEDDKVRYEAVWALAEIKDPTAVEPLIESLLNDDYSGAAAAWVIGRFKDSRAVEPLIKVLDEDWADLREHAAESLGEIGDKRAIEPLVRLLEDKEERVRFRAAYGLGMLGDGRGFPLLIDQVQKKREKSVKYRGAVWRAAQALGELGDVRAVQPLLKALPDGNETFRMETANALGKLGDPAAIDSLIGLLGDKASSVRVAAVQALGQFGSEAALAKLGDMALNDEGANYDDVTVKEVALLAIEQIKGAVEKRKKYP